MKKHNHSKAQNINPVSRKTNEEIDEDEAGNLIVGGEYVSEENSNLSKGIIDDDLINDNQTLNNQELGKED